MSKGNKIIVMVVMAAFLLLGQSAVAFAAGESFFVTFMPSYPAPNSQASVKIESYNIDLDSSDVVWILDGKTVDKGMGKKALTLTFPELGKTKNLKISVTASDGSKSSQVVDLVGNDMDLLEESSGYAPSWYKGKSLVVQGGGIKLTSVPYLFANGQILPKSELVYDWFLNYKKDMNQSGGGKNFFKFTIKDSRDYVVTVEVSNKDSSIVFKKTARFSAAAEIPKIIFYEDNPLEGIKTNAALSKEILLSSGEMGLRAEPYYFSDIGNLSYGWSMNGKKIGTDVLPNVFSFRTGEDARSGIAVIELGIDSLTKIMQSARAKLGIRF